MRTDCHSGDEQVFIELVPSALQLVAKDSNVRLFFL